MAYPRSLTLPESSRSGLAVLDYAELIGEADRPAVAAYVNMVASAPGAAVLVWGDDALCIAYNRDYRMLASVRMSVLGKPLFQVQPELERFFGVKFELALAGQGSQMDPPSGSGRPAELGLASEPYTGWILPLLTGDGSSKGALLLFSDLAPALDPLRRLVGAVGHELRDPLIGIRVLSERLSRAPKLTAERCAADLGRVLDMAAAMERIIDDMSTYAKLTSGSAQLNLAVGDLGAIVREVCEGMPKPNAEPPPPLRVSTVETRGAWDDDVVARMVSNLVAHARAHAVVSAEICVDLGHTHEGAVLSMRYEARGGRDDEMEQIFDSGRRSSPSLLERGMSGSGLRLLVVRELVQMHRGRVSFERSGASMVTVRVILPMGGSGIYRR